MLRARWCREREGLWGSVIRLSVVEGIECTLHRPKHQPLKPTSHRAPGQRPRQKHPLGGGVQPVGTRAQSEAVKWRESLGEWIPD